MNLRIASLVLPMLLGCSVTWAGSTAHHAANHAAQQKEMSFEQALEAVQKAGYKNIHKIEIKHNRYEVEAFDANGKEIEFNIDPKTGVVSAAKECHKHHGKKHAAKHAKHHAKKHAAKHAETEAAEAAKQ